MKEEILNRIWGKSYHYQEARSALPYLAIIDRRTDTFKEKAWTFGGALETHLIQYEQQDQFFSPLLFEGPRTNDTASLPGVLFADLDSTDKLPYGVPRPTILWETSPGNKQAVWFLAKAPPSAVRWADLNQRLTYAAHADKGGWHASKLLRIPETRNFKYPEAPLGKVLWFEPNNTYTFEFFDALLPILEKHVVVTDDHPRPLEHPAWKAYVKAYWDALSLEQRSLIVQKQQQDRSGAIVRLSNDLARSGFPPTARFNLIWGMAWNKWRTDRHNPSYLWQVVNT